MKTLSQIMEFTTTDKRPSEHDYTNFYEELLESKRNAPLKILEIGIYRPPTNSIRKVAASLLTWYEYLPNATIYGLDLESFKDIENDRVKTKIANQGIPQHLQAAIDEFGTDFDVIIDDGGHCMNQHQISLGFLFRHLKSKGCYVIEDLHTCNMPQCVRGMKKTTEILKEIQEGKLSSPYINEEDSKYILENTDRVEIKMGRMSEISFHYKK